MQIFCISFYVSPSQQVRDSFEFWARFNDVAEFGHFSAKVQYNSCIKIIKKDACNSEFGLGKKEFENWLLEFYEALETSTRGWIESQFMLRWLLVIIKVA